MFVILKKKYGDNKQLDPTSSDEEDGSDDF